MKIRKTNRTDSPTLKYGSKDWEAPATRDEKPRTISEEEGIECDTFLNDHKIKADPTINLSAFIEASNNLSNKYHRIDIKDVEYWKLMENPNTSEKYYERVKEPVTLYLKDTTPVMIDNMICNYIDPRIHKGVRISVQDDFIVIEPSNIRIPLQSMSNMLVDNTDLQNDPVVLRNIGVDTFICNFISDFTRGGRTRIPEQEVGVLRERFMNRSIAPNNNSVLSSSDFMFMFSSYMYENGRTTFDRSDLMTFIYLNQGEEKYKSILGNLKVYRHEHYDVSDDLEFAIACLKYIGIIKPDYERDHPYEYLRIDDSISRFVSVYDQKEKAFPSANELFKQYKKRIVERELN